MISSNGEGKSLYGGGVSNNGTFQMYGGGISRNSCTRLGGGVCGGMRTLTVGGGAVISGNTYNGAENNVYLDNEQTVTVDSTNPLSGLAKIGITTASLPNADNPVNITGKNGTDYSSYFHSDNPGGGDDKPETGKGEISQEIQKGENAPELSYTQPSP